MSDSGPGIRRRRAGKGFAYRDASGALIRDPETLRRIRSLAIPPAYTRVWICPYTDGHLQATGYDARGRKQYRYHPLWREVRDETKFHRMVAFGRMLPALRARTCADLAEPGLSRRKVLAAVVQLLEKTRIRIGNEAYCRQNHSYGLTTLCHHHLDVGATTLHFHFRGKGGQSWEIDLRDRRLARVVQRLQDLPGQELFQYREASGSLHSVTSADVNRYIHEIAGEAFTAKDFRTWAGTVLAARAFVEIGPPGSPAEARRNMVAVVKGVAGQLGNTPAVCRKSYIDPGVIEGYLNGSLIEQYKRAFDNPEGGISSPEEDHASLQPYERAVLGFLESTRGK